jgi:hypothetical protein
MKNMLKSVITAVFVLSFVGLSAQKGWKVHDFGISDPVRYVDAQFLNYNEGLIVSDSGKVLKTYDGGKTWKVIEFQKANPHEIIKAMHFVNDSTGFMNSRYFVYRSDDGGESWSNFNSGVYQYVTMIKQKNGSVSFCGDYAFGQFVIRNYSVEHDTFDLNVGFFPIGLIEVAEKIGDSTLIIPMDSGKLYRYTNLGESVTMVYNPASDGMPGVGVKDVHFINADTGFACYNNITMKLTTDGGLTWKTDTSFSMDVPGDFTVSLLKLSSVGDRVYLSGVTYAAAYSLYQYNRSTSRWEFDAVFAGEELNFSKDLAGVTGFENALFVPISKGQLAYHTQWDFINNVSEPEGNTVNIYPNPTSNRMTLDFTETLDVKGEIEVYNLQGILLKSVKLESGTRSVQLDIEPKGMWFLRLKTGSYSHFVGKVLVH